LTAFLLFPGGAYPFLHLNETAFLKTCRFDTYMASGHGGQKRNRTYSAVRLIHLPTALMVIAEESRSQAENKLKALKRLRMAIALRVRKQSSPAILTIPGEIREYFKPDAPLQINPKNPLYPLACATVLDAVHVAEGKIGDASQLLDVSTGRLNKFFSRDRDLLSTVNELRAHFNLKPLKSA
jgi:hypothetical protein